MKDKVLYIIIGVLLGVIIMQARQGPRPARAQSDTITAEHFVLVDAQGNKRGEWRSTASGSQFLMLSDEPKSKFRVHVGAHSSSFQLSSPKSLHSAAVNDNKVTVGIVTGDENVTNRLQTQVSQEFARIALISSNQSTIEFVKWGGEETTYVRRLILGNTYSPIRLDDGSEVSRPMGSIVVVGDSATITIP
jgi:hypothetical protein